MKDEAEVKLSCGRVVDELGLEVGFNASGISDEKNGYRLRSERVGGESE